MADLSRLMSGSSRPATPPPRARRQVGPRPLPIAQRSRPAPTSRTTPPGPRAARGLALLQKMQASGTGRRVERPLQPPPPEAPPSLWEQARGLVAGIPQGVIGLGTEAVETALAVPRLAFDAARGDLKRDEQFEGPQSFLAHYAPAFNTIGSSVVNTGRNLMDPSRYAEASREGRILPTIVEDIGNVALVGGAGAKVLGRTSAPTTLATREATAAAGQMTPRAVGALAADDIAIAPLVRRGATDPALMTRIVPTPELRTITLPGRGLAGVAERAGQQGLAEGLARAGRAVRTVSRLGERGANLPAYPYVGAARLGGRAVEAVTGRRPGAVARSLVDRAGARGGVLFPATEEGRQFNRVKANIERSNVEAQRFAITPARIAADAGLAPELQRAALFSVDQAVRPVVDTVRQYGDQVGDAAIDEMITRAYANVEPGQRPTPADVRAVIAFEDGAIGQQETAAMNAVAAAQRRISQQRTDVLVNDMPEGEGLNPEQLGTEQRSFVLERERRKIERIRDRSQRQWDVETERATRLSRIADAIEAVNASLPAPPDSRASFQIGKTAGRAAKGESLARRMHATTVRALDKAIAEYERLEAGPTEAVRKAAQNVDRLTERAVELEAMVRQAERRVQAATPLSRATSELAETAPGVNRPTPDISQAENVTALRRRAKELGAEQARQVFGEIEEMTQGNRPLMPKIDRQGNRLPDGPPGYDWWDDLSSADRRRLQREGWLRARTGRGARGFEPDQMAQLAGMADVDAFMARYVEAVRRYHDAIGGRTPELVTQVADELGIPVESVRTALRGSADDYRAGLVADVNTMMDEVRGDYLALGPDERASFDLTASSMMNDPGAQWGDFAELLDAYLPGADVLGTNGVLATFGDMVPLRDVVAWMRTGDLSPAMRAVVAARGPAQIRQLGRLGGAETAARTRLSDVYGEQRAARGVLGAAERQQAAQRAQAGRSVNRADAATTRAEGALPPEVGPRLSELVPDQDTTWRRGSGMRSQGEHARIREGATRARADAAQARVARLRRSIDRANQRIADLPDELSRTFQERLTTDINRPVIVRIRNVVRRAGTELGELVTDKAVAERLSGNLGRLAGKYGVTREVVAVLKRMEDDIKGSRALAAVTDEGGTPLAEISPIDRGDVLTRVLERRGITMEAVDAQSLADSVGADQLLDDIAEVTLADRQGGVAANTPYRVADLVERTDWRMPDDVRSEFRKVFEQYEKRRASHLGRLMDRYTEAAPARFRTLMITGRRQVRALLDMAEERNRVEPGSGDIFIRMGENTATTLNEFVDAGIDPTHLIGGDEISTAFTAGGGRKLSQRRLRAQQVRREGLRPLDPAAYARLEADQAAKMIHNRTSRYVVDVFGRRADQVPEIADAMRRWEEAQGEAMPPGELAKAAQEAGWVPAEGTAVAPQTMLVTDAISRQLQASRLDSSKVWQALSTGNRKWKSWVLPLSPKWVTGNIIGNAIQAAVHAGVNPVTLARRMREISKMSGGLGELWERSGLPEFTPAEIASHGLSFNEWRIMYQDAGVEARTPVGRLIARSYRLNEFVDNMTRSAVFLEKLRDGLPSEAALNVSLKALGDFTRMSSFERRVVREILPFYAWLRHQTMATLRLPIHSPTRAAWLLHLSDLYTDDDMQASLLELMGSSIPLGGDKFLDAGGISPFATLPEIPFAPTAIGRAVTPLIKVPLGIATGMDLNRGGQQYSRPADTFRIGAFGQKEPTPPLYRLFTDPIRGVGEIGYVAAQQAPTPVRSIRDLVLGDEARYGAGYAVSQSGGRPLEDVNRNLPSIALRAVGLPSIRTIDIEEQQRRAREAQRRGG